MALGTATVVSRMSWADGHIVNLSFLGDGTYPAGGTPDFTDYVRAAIKADNAAKDDANVRGAESVTILGLIDNYCGVYHAVYDHANDKLMALTEANVDATPGDLSGTTFKVTVICK